MAGNILIAHRNEAEAIRLDATLDSAGYQIRRVHGLAGTLAALLASPQLLLLDTGLLRQATAAELEAVRQALEIAETLCLRICDPGEDFDAAQALSPFACGSVYLPIHAAALREQVAALLRIKTAEAACHRAQEQLMLQRMEVEEGLRSAAQIQHTLLPSHTRLSDHYQFAWQFVPCQTVGGDLINLLQISEDCLAAYILDVSGHGVSSALVTVSVNQSLSDRTSRIVKTHIDQPPYFHINAPADVLTALDAEFPFERFQKFFTMTYLLLDRTGGRLRYANAGHPAPILIRRDGELRRLEAGGTLIGLGGLLPYEEEEIALEAGDRVYLFSDGISEYEAPGGEMFGEERLIDFLLGRNEVPLEQALDDFMPMLHAFGENAVPKDDISLLAIEYRGPRA